MVWAACGRLGVELRSLSDAGVPEVVSSGVDAGGQAGVVGNGGSGGDEQRAGQSGAESQDPRGVDARADAGVLDAAVGGAGGVSLDASVGGAGAGGGASDAAVGSGAGLRDAAAGSVDAGGSSPDAGRDGGVADAGGDGSVADAGPAYACGNSVTEPGEQCDDGVGGSASCDSDCTFSACGDGVHNALAGEQCDSADQLSSCSAICQLPACRSGCTCELYHGVRYMFCPEQLAWDPARQACQDAGMHLLRLASGTEHTFVRLHSLQNGFPKFHLGASDVNVEGTWVWEDETTFWIGRANGTPVDGQFSAWAAGEPNAFTVDENCSEVQSLQGWNDCPCTQTKPFICKEARARLSRCGDAVVDLGEACDGGGETAACDLDCSPAVCGDGVVNLTAGERCDDGGSGQYCSGDCSQLLCPSGCSCIDAEGKRFAVCSQPAAFRDAAVDCGRAGMTLARVDSVTVDQALRTAANGAGLGEFWIGVFDIDQPNHWLRSDLSLAWDGTAAGTSHGYTNFASGSPSGTTNQDCVAVLTNGRWHDRDCSVQKPFACESL